MEFKTVQQYYTAADNNQPLVREHGDRQYALNFPEGVQVYKFTHEKVNIFDVIPFRITNENHPLVASKKILADGQSIDDIFVYYEHRNINENGDSVICNRMTYGKKCPICEEQQRVYEALKAAGNTEPWKDDKFKALKPKARVIANVIDYRDREKGIQVLTGADFIIRQGILNGAKVNRGDAEHKNTALLDLGQTFTLEQYDYKTKETKVSEYLYFASPTNGFGVEVECIPDVFDGRDYAKPISFALRARKQQYARDIVDKSYDLPAFLVQRTYDEVEKIFYGVATDDEAPVETKASIQITEPEAGEMPKRPEAEAPKIQLGEVSVNTPPVEEKVDTVAEPKTCSYGFTEGMDWETKPECSVCLDENTEQYKECKRIKLSLETL